MADTDKQTEQEILELAHEWMEAIGRRDAAMLDKIIADDFVLTGWSADGQLTDKKSYLEDCLRPVNVENASYRYERLKFRTYGDTVIVNCTFSSRAIVGGKEWGGDFLLTDVWVREDGQWRVVTRHSNPLISPPSA